MAAITLPETHSAMKLAAELRKAGLGEMADRAATGYYHDFLSELTFPDMQLLADLDAAIAAGNQSAKRLRGMHLNGEFDATLAESEDWENSPEGQQAFASMFGVRQ